MIRLPHKLDNRLELADRRGSLAGSGFFIGGITMEQERDYPKALDSSKVGTYSGSCKSGGGCFYDEVLEYRVWCYRKSGGDDFYYAFDTYEKALWQQEALKKRGKDVVPEDVIVALVLQKKYIAWDKKGVYISEEPRITEWPDFFLEKERRHPDENALNKALEEQTRLYNKEQKRLYVKDLLKA